MDQPLRDIYLQSVSDAQTILRLKSINADLVIALQPFANYACDPSEGPCDCHNCRARAAIDAATQPTND